MTATSPSGSADDSSPRRVRRIAIAARNAFPLLPEPHVVPPVGAGEDVWELSEFEGGPNGGMPRYAWHCDVFTPPRVALNCTDDPLRSPVVTVQAVRWADGSLDREGVVRMPSIEVDSPHEPGLTAAQARALAALLVQAADELDGWLAPDRGSR
ncbi:MAG: hypothetical protein K2Q25_07975 [Mycobacteriaceae bacterium]|nr:hypothetical protein [Mycobacteriaceae bacterium]